MTKPKLLLQFPGIVERVHKHKTTISVATNFGEVTNWVPSAMIHASSRKKGAPIVLRTWEKGERIWCTVGKRKIARMTKGPPSPGIHAGDSRCSTVSIE